MADALANHRRQLDGGHHGLAQDSLRVANGARRRLATQDRSEGYRPREGTGRVLPPPGPSVIKPIGYSANRSVNPATARPPSSGTAVRMPASPPVSGERD